MKRISQMKDVIGKAMGLMKGYLEEELNKLPINENVRYYDDVETLENPLYNEFKHFMKPRKWYRMVIDDAENKVFVWDANTSLLHQEMDDIHNLKESLHLFIHNGKPYLQDYDLDDYNLSNKEEFYVIAKSYDESQLFKKYFPNYSIVNDLKKAFKNDGKYIAESRFIRFDDLPSDKYDVYRVYSADYLKKHINNDIMILVHGKLYRPVKVGKNKNYEDCVKLESIDNPKDVGVRTFKYLAKDSSYIVYEKNNNEKLNEEYEGLNRLAGFYWFDEKKFQMLKRKPMGVKELSKDDNQFDYYHLDSMDGLEEDNKARFGIEKIGKKLVCYIEAEDKQKCLMAKKAIQRKFSDILIDKFQLSWGRNNFEELYESIVYAEMEDDEMVVILHNPTRKELKDNDLDDECRIVYDGQGGYYFASSQFTHEEIEQKLQANNLPYSETSGEFYFYQDNLFATRDDWSSEKEYQEYKNDWYQSLKSMPYIVKNFGNFKVEIFKGEYLSEEINEVLKLAGVK